MSTVSLCIGDIRYALRRWISHPGFAATAILILALGIGVTTAIYSIVDAVLLQPLPWPASDRLVAVYAVLPERRGDPAAVATWNRAPISWSAWHELRKEPVFEEVGVWFRSRYIFGHPGEDTVEVWHVSASFPGLLGARPTMGRLFVPGEDDDPNSDVVIISHECWQRRYGGRQDVVGQPASLAFVAGETVTKTIIGVLSPGFRLRGEPPEFLLPMGLRSRFAASSHAIARLAPGVPLRAAAPVAESIIAGGATASPQRSAKVVPLEDDVRGQSAPQLWLLLAGAGLLLLIACANVAGLLLSESRARAHEISIRTALGATRRWILRQLIVEQLLLGGMAGIAGLFLAMWLTPALAAMAPDELPGVAKAGFNIRMALFAVVLGIMTVGLFGLGPALMVSSTETAPTLSEGRRHATARRPGAQRAIVAGELTLAFVLLVCATLFGETIARLTSRPLGFDPTGVAVVSLKVSQFPKVTAAPGQLPLFASWTHTAGLIERLTALPGVVSAAGVSTVPFHGGWRTVRLRAENGPRTEEQDVHLQVVTEGYFRTMGLPLLAGRDLGLADRRSGIDDHNDGVVISRELARRLFGDNAVGQRLVGGASGGGQPFMYEVVGVVGNAKQREFVDDEPATAYFLASAYSSINDVVIWTSGDPRAMLPVIRRTIRDYDPYTLVTATTTMESLVARSVAEERFRANLSMLFGGAALLLSAVGLYGLAARQVAQRRRDIGVRLALGARPNDVLRLVLREAAIPVAVGILIGLPAGLATARILGALLFGVSPMAPHVFS